MTFTPEKPFRLAILECDTPMKRVLETRGTLGDIFTRHFRTAASALQPALDREALHITTYDVVTKMEYPALADIDGYLMTGSQYMPDSSDEWIIKLGKFIKRTLADGRVRIVAVCFGHQMLGRALGFVAETKPAWEISVMDVQLTSKGQEVFGRKTLAIQQMRRALIRDGPNDVDETMYTSACTHGLYRQRQFISIQGHPEYDGEIMRWVVEDRKQRGIIPEKVANDGLARADDKTDGALVFMKFLEFLIEG